MTVARSEIVADSTESAPQSTVRQRSETTLVRDRDVEPLVRQTVATLEEDIVLGFLNPKERLVEDDLRNRFGQKRHVVRQVLTELERMGLVERRKNVGALVRAYTAKEVYDLYAVRHILETSCARQIPLPVPQSRLNELISIQGVHDASVADSNLRAAYRANVAFHKALFALVDNVMLSAAIEDYAQRANSIRSSSMVFPEYLEKARREHWAIIDALKTGDRERLVELCRNHLIPSRDAYVDRYRRRHGDDGLPVPGGQRHGE